MSTNHRQRLCTCNQPCAPNGRPWPIDPSPEQKLREENARLRARLHDIESRICLPISSGED